MAQTSLNGLRLYGVAAFDGALHQPLAEGTTSVQFRSIAGIVSPAKYSRVTVDDGELREYTRILEEVHANTAILPAPPGTVFRSRDNLARWLELHYFTLTQAIGSIEGHAQARLKITKSAGVDAANATAVEIGKAASSFWRLRRKVCGCCVARLRRRSPFQFRTMTRPSLRRRRFL